MSTLQCARMGIGQVQRSLSSERIHQSFMFSVSDLNPQTVGTHSFIILGLKIGFLHFDLQIWRLSDTGLRGWKPLLAFLTRLQWFLRHCIISPADFAGVKQRGACSVIMGAHSMAATGQ